MKCIYKILDIRKAILCLMSFSIGTIFQTDGQTINPFSNSYFQNQYLLNPAMADGVLKGLDFDIGYRKEGLSVTDAPRSQYFTGAYGISDKVGVGLNIYNDKAGLINTTRAMATYAYHVPLNADKSKLLLGISAGVWKARIDNAAIIGNPDDPGIGKFNDRGAQFDADFGAAYESGALTIQGAFPGMVTYFKKDQEDIMGRMVLFAAASYRFSFKQGENAIGLEPKISYRDLEGFDNVLDVGANATFMNNLFNIFGMYHSTKDVSFGAGFNVKDMVNINMAYNTGTSGSNGYSKESVEVGIGLMLKK